MFPLLIKRAAGQGAKKTASAPPDWGFTLVELLVSMSVLLLVMVLTVQLVGRATSITSASNKLVDTATMARTLLDRLGDDLANSTLNGGLTMLHYSGVTVAPNTDPTVGANYITSNSALGFVCKSRARKVSSDGASDPNQDVRGVVVAYKVRPTAVTLRPGYTLNIPLINRGDAEFTFSKTGSQGTNNGAYSFSVWDMFGTASATTSSSTYSLPNDLSATSTTSDVKLLAWTGFGDGILRFHVSFVLNDGRIVQTLEKPSLNLKATYKDFKSNGTPTPCQTIAFSAANSADANQRYVTGIIVGIVTLDQTNLNLGYAQKASFATDLASVLKRPTNDGETPLAIWQANLNGLNTVTPRTVPLPIQQSLRFYQRFYPINL